MVEEDFDAWSEENLDQAFDVESFANDVYKERIRLAVGSGEAPTLIVGRTGGTLLEYVDGEFVLDSSAETAELSGRLIDSVADNGVIDGSTYAVPMNNVQPAVLYYNQEVFDEVGVSVPTDWDQMLEAIDTFNEAGVYPFALAGGSTVADAHVVGLPDSVVGNPANVWSVSSDASEESQDAALGYLSEHLFNDEYVERMLETGNFPQLENLDLVFQGDITPEEFAETMNATQSGS